MEVSAAITHYCQYQERCHSEVRNKLYELGCITPEVEQLLTQMIDSNLLNEERFARSFARGKFRLKYWGRVKIKNELRMRKISEYCIKKAFTEIDDEDYEKTLNRLLEKKVNELRNESNSNILYSKLYRYLIQKGYENDIVINLLTEKIKNKKN